jgi:hypothetical protein
VNAHQTLGTQRRRRFRFRGRGKSNQLDGQDGQSRTHYNGNGLVILLLSICYLTSDPFNHWRCPPTSRPIVRVAGFVGVDDGGFALVDALGRSGLSRVWADHVVFRSSPSAEAMMPWCGRGALAPSAVACWTRRMNVSSIGAQQWPDSDESDKEEWDDYESYDTFEPYNVNDF